MGERCPFRTESARALSLRLRRSQLDPASPCCAFNTMPGGSSPAPLGDGAARGCFLLLHRRPEPPGPTEAPGLPRSRQTVASQSARVPGVAGCFSGTVPGRPPILRTSAVGPETSRLWHGLGRGLSLLAPRVCSPAPGRARRPLHFSRAHGTELRAAYKVGSGEMSKRVRAGTRAGVNLTRAPTPRNWGAALERQLLQARGGDGAPSSSAAGESSGCWTPRPRPPPSTMT